MRKVSVDLLSTSEKNDRVAGIVYCKVIIIIIVMDISMAHDP